MCRLSFLSSPAEITPLLSFLFWKKLVSEEAAERLGLAGLGSGGAGRRGAGGLLFRFFPSPLGSQFKPLLLAVTALALELGSLGGGGLGGRVSEWGWGVRLKKTGPGGASVGAGWGRGLLPGEIVPLIGL